MHQDQNAPMDTSKQFCPNPACSRREARSGKETFAFMIQSESGIAVSGAVRP
jgi:hypothetical protein